MAEGGKPEMYEEEEDEQSQEVETEEGRRRVGQRVLDEKERLSKMNQGHKRRIYKCEERFVKLEDIPTWPNYSFAGKTDPRMKKSPLRRVNPELNEKVSLLRGDITTLEIDAIVNAAKESLMGGGGVDGAIHSAAGPYLKHECSLMGGCAPGDAKITSGYRLPATHVIHTVGPIGEKRELLRRTYRTCLEVLVDSGLRSVAIPCISTGIFGYDVHKATPVALETVREFLEEKGDNIDRVILCVYEKRDVEVYEEMMSVYFPTSSSDQEEQNPTETGPPLVNVKKELQDPATTPCASDPDVTLSLTTPRPSTPTQPDLRLIAGHPDRSQREPALLPAREVAREKELLEAYWSKSERGRVSLAIFVGALEEGKKKRTLKASKSVLFDIIKELNELRESLAGRPCCEDVDLNLDELTNQAAIAKEEYYQLFPRAYSAAPSSVLTSSMVSGETPTPQQAVMTAQAVTTRLEAVEETKRQEREAKRKMEELDEETRNQIEETRQRAKALKETEEEEDRKVKAQKDKEEEEERQRIKEQKEKAKVQKEKEEEDEREAKARAEEDEREAKARAEEDERVAKARREEEERQRTKEQKEKAKAQKEKAEEEERRRIKAREERQQETARQEDKRKREREEQREKLRQQEQDLREASRDQKERLKEELKRTQEETKLKAEMAVAKMVYRELEGDRSMPDLPKINRLDDFLEDAVTYQKEGLGPNDIGEEEKNIAEVGTVDTNLLRGATTVGRGNKLSAPPPSQQLTRNKPPIYQHTLPILHENEDVKLKGRPEVQVNIPKQQSRTNPRPYTYQKPNSITPQAYTTGGQRGDVTAAERPKLKLEAPWQQREQTKEERGTRWNPSDFHQTKAAPTTGTNTTTTRTTTTTMTPMAQASCLHKSMPRNHQSPMSHPAPFCEPDQYNQTVYYPLEPQSNLNPKAEPFSYQGHLETTSTQTEDREEEDGTASTQTEQTEAREERMEGEREASALTRGIQQMSKSLAEAISTNRLPVQEPEIFHGDPLLYPTWRASFSLLIERQTISADEKLIYLQRFLGGAAKDAVQGLFLMRGKEAYYKALSMLEERFGCPIVVARAFRDKFDSWPTVKSKDGEGMRKLADFLQQCLIASRVVGQLNILDDPQYQRTLMDRLPDWLQRGWLAKVTKTKKKTGQYPPFGELVDFITDKADTACEPVFTLNVKTTPPTGLKTPNTASQRRLNYYVAAESGTHSGLQSGGPPGQYSSPAYNTGQTRPPCGSCGETTHNILVCRRFLNLDPSQRIKFLFEKNLCFSCALTGRHWTRDCPTKPKCKECGRQHLTVLHSSPRLDIPLSRARNAGPNTQDERAGMSGQDTPREGASPPPAKGALHFGEPRQGSKVNANQRLLTEAQANYNSQGGGNTASGADTQATTSRSTSTYGAHSDRSDRTSMMIPVLISSKEDPQTEIKTYALLDTMSCVTFVANTVAKRLKVKSKNTALRLNTMTSRAQPVDCAKISGLQIRAVHSRNRHSLPEVFTTTNLSLNPENVPTRETAENHSHLRRIVQDMPEYDPSCEAGLLIGYDCSDLLMPLEIIRGQPFAVRTILGWSIVGNASPINTTMDVRFASCFEETRESDTDEETVINVFRTNIVETSTTEALKLMERDFVETETGTKSQEDVLFMDIIGGNITRNQEGHYEMPLPFKHGKPQMPDNREVARKRILGLLRRFDKDKEHKQRYQALAQGLPGNPASEKKVAAKTAQSGCRRRSHYARRSVPRRLEAGQSRRSVRGRGRISPQVQGVSRGPVSKLRKERRKHHSFDLRAARPQTDAAGQGLKEEEETPPELCAGISVLEDTADPGLNDEATQLSQVPFCVFFLSFCPP